MFTINIFFTSSSKQDVMCTFVTTVANVWVRRHLWIWSVHLNVSLLGDSATPIGVKAIHHDTSNGHRCLRVV